MPTLTGISEVEFTWRADSTEFARSLIPKPQMAQRLRQTASRAGYPLAVHGRQVISAYEQLASIIRDRLGRRHADLLAVPTVDATGEIAWSTLLNGAVAHEDDLTVDARERLQQRAQSILRDIRELSVQLHSEGRDAAQMAAQMLEHATQSPAGHWLYSVGDEPVLIMWGHADAAPAPPLARDSDPSLSASRLTNAEAARAPFPHPPARDIRAAGQNIPPVTTGEPVGTSSDAAIEKRKKRVWPFLLVSVILAAFLGIALYFFSGLPADEDSSAQPKAADKDDKALEEKIARQPRDEGTERQVPDTAEPSQPEPEEAKPLDRPKVAQSSPLESLKQRIAAAKQDCAALKQLLMSEPLLQGSDADSVALKDQVVGTLATHCKEKLITEAKNLCPGVRPQALAPELVIVFDASGSMQYSLLATEQEIHEAAVAEAMIGALRAFGAQIPGSPAEKVFREPKRITAAKQAALAIARKIPADANVGLVLIEDCPFARRVGFFPPGQHGALLAQLQAIQPKGGTPLADGIAKAGQMLDGVTREAVMLVVSDGQESCRRDDPCAIASALARAKPHLKINVVDITGTGAGNCLARATNGKVYPANNADQIALVTRQAAADALAPAHCK